MNVAPVVLFVYNRPNHTLQTLEALAKNDLASESVLYIFADGPKENASLKEVEDIKETRLTIRLKKWCKEVHIVESDVNKGLADSVIEGVTKIVNEYGKIIVLEDDLVTSKSFLSYMNGGLEKFAEEEKVMQISGFMFPLQIEAKHSSFFLHFATSWGWGTWQRAWKLFDPLARGFEKVKTDKSLANRFDINQTYPYSEMLLNQIEHKLIDSWAIRWWWSLFMNDGVTLFPDKSLVENIGYGAGATHTKEINLYSNDKFDPCYLIKNYPLTAIADTSFAIKLEQYLRRQHERKEVNNLFRNVYKKLKTFFK